MFVNKYYHEIGALNNLHNFFYIICRKYQIHIVTLSDPSCNKLQMKGDETEVQKIKTETYFAW